MWPAAPAAQPELARTHTLLSPRVSDTELSSFERMLSAADAAAMARHAQRVRARDAGKAGEAGEDAAALFDAVIAIVEGACGSSCPLPPEPREPRVVWVAQQLTTELGLVRRGQMVDSDRFVSALAEQLHARIATRDA